MTSYPSSSKSTSGFSLVEATLAMGIAAVGMMTLMGVVPWSLDLLRESASDVAEAKIIQTVVADYQMTDWGQRSANMKPADKVYYFDQRGLQVDQGTFAHQFTAQAKVDPVNPKIPGDTTANVYMRRVVVKITDRINDPSAFDNPRHHQVHGALVTLLDQTGKL